MSLTETQPDDEQPLVTVKDYRPSCHSSSSSSDAPESTDGEFDFEDVERQCPFAHLPKKSRLGKLYNTRYSKGLWGETPIVTTVETPCILRCWAINGPDEFYDEQEQREPFNMDDDTIIPMTGSGLLHSHRQTALPPPRPRARVGKMSPLQKCNIKIVPPAPQRAPTLPCKASSALALSDMLSTKGRLVEDPCGLSDSSSDSESPLNSNFQPSMNSSNSTSINFCLCSDEDTGSEESHQPFDEVYQLSLLSATTSSSMTDPERQIETLTQRVEQLMSVANSLQDQLTASNREKTQLQQQVQTLQTMRLSSEESTSPRNVATENIEDMPPGRRSPRAKCLAREGERLRMELLQEKQKTAEVQLENERLLAVILKLKYEMDFEHDLCEKFQKKAGAGQTGGKWQKFRQVVRSSSGLWDSKKRPTHQRGWSFGRTRSRKR
ncbi:hypothetical protein FGB62_88g02 [Gracilaria domingensis]|nr:hypothetical protein FGB62_88g02 [Gracilaria domingensis]